MKNHNYDEGVKLIHALEPDKEMYSFIAWVNIDSSWKLIFATDNVDSVAKQEFGSSVGSAISSDGIDLTEDDVVLYDTSNPLVKASRMMMSTGGTGIGKAHSSGNIVNGKRLPDALIYRA